MGDLLSQKHIDKIVGAFGQAGREWIDELPGRLAVCEAHWYIGELTPFQEEAWNFVGYSEKRGVVVKCFYDQAEFERQKAILSVAERQGLFVKLLSSLTEQKALLLSRVMPGKPMVTEIGEKTGEYFRVVSEIIRECWQIPVNDYLRSDSELIEEYEEGKGRIDDALIDAGKRELEKLLELETEDKVFAHGDLHAGNVLRSGIEWKLIDPEGFSTSRYFDPAYFLCCSADLLPIRPLIGNQLKPFAEMLDLNPDVLTRWAFALEVLRRSCDGGDNLPVLERNVSNALYLRETVGAV